MHHHRISVNGPSGTTERLIEELEGLGARAIQFEGSELVLTSNAPASPWVELTTRHPGTRISVESFEAFGDEVVSEVVADGVTTVMARESCSADCGGFHDEDGV